MEDSAGLEMVLQAALDQGKQLVRSFCNGSCSCELFLSKGLELFLISLELCFSSCV